MTLESFLLDLILAVIIGLSVFLSAKRGFVRTFIEAVGFVAAAIIVFTVCTPLANATYDKIIEPPILEIVSEEVNENFKDTLAEIPDFDANAEKVDEIKTQLSGSVDEVLKSLPPFVQNFIDKAGIDADELLNNAEDIVENGATVEDTAQKLTKDISQNKIKPLVARVLSYIYSFVLFVIALILVKILARILNKAFSFSLAGKLNTALGGVCGFAKGVIFALLLCLIIYTVISFTENGIWIFSVENIDKTFIFKYLISLIKI